MMETTELLFTGLKLEEIDAIASSLLQSSQARIFLFEGPMGSGKTTLIKALCRALGSKDAFSSPTYSIVNEYAFPGGTIAHFDLYRLSEVDQLLDIGIEEYLDSGSYCFIEWPALAAGLIETPYVRCEITLEDDKRFLACTACAPRGV